LRVLIVNTSPHTTHQDTGTEHPFIVVFGEMVQDGLARLILLRRWDWLRATRADEVVELLIRRPRPALVVMQSDRDVDQSIILLRFLRMPWRNAPAIVIDMSSNGMSEGALRTAGAVVHLPANASEWQIEHAIVECLASSMLRRGMALAATPHDESGTALARTTAQPARRAI